MFTYRRNGGASEHGEYRNATAFDSLAAAFLAVHQHQSSHYLATLGLDGIDGLDGGTTGGDYVVHHDDFLTGFKITFDALATAMVLGLLAHIEYLEGLIGLHRIHTDSQRNGVSTHGHATDCLHIRILGHDFLLHEFPTHLTDEIGTASIQSGDAAVAVQIALLAGSKNEMARLD